MDFEVAYTLDNAQQFWDELDDIVGVECERDDHEAIDNALRSYLKFCGSFKEEYLQSDIDIVRCTYTLLDSGLFTAHKEYIRRQFVYGLLQEDDAPSLYLMAAILHYDGRTNDETFEMMQQEGAFPRLVELIQNQVGDGDFALHRMLLELLYEMSRMQALTYEDLSAVDDAFVLYLFRIIEELSDDANDPYHYPVIRVLLVLNEQYMVLSTLTTHRTTALPNRVLSTLSNHNSTLKTFGENIILLLNREDETSLQLLILKLLYLLFSSRSTAEYFYTNDLHVLLDVILRNLLDLPAEGASALALRHTYLRVLGVMVANSQLSKSGGSYKRAEVRKILNILAREDHDGVAAKHSANHFAPVDETTLRLIKRVKGADWLADTEDEIRAAREARGEDVEAEKEAEANGGLSPSTPTTATTPLGEGQKELARRMLGMTVRDAGASALSVVEVAAQHEKPGVLSPSRQRGFGEEPGVGGIGIEGVMGVEERSRNGGEV
ncbi:hypothetical protein K402DRAFT_381620 [Aulographum hederae CBS 113979]|uniref:SPIN90/Ldb17 leucine-rich domain-containing protein n=1 Tax=Aulographum hederae CBS 113979 TaxID=1176131 RepID=A0A6G1GTC6_9PEZI|nr:hypothetical protein K402DRAFT_381620 [Aulographum hederae CBS 113979]